MMTDNTKFEMPVYNFWQPLIFLMVITAGLLFTACSGSKSVVPLETDKSVEIDGDLSDWPHSKALLQEGNYFNYYAMHDSQNLYLYVNLKSAQYLQLVENTGLTIYVSANKKNKKAFGLTYPVGAYNFLKQMPGTYQKFKQDPQWERKPKNQKLLEKLRSDNYNQAMVTQRESKKDTPQEVIIDLSRLEAQGVKIAREQLHNRLQIEVSIPLQSSPTQQFAVIPNKDRQIHLGFTVTPPDKQWDQGSTTVDLSQNSPSRARTPYGRVRNNQEMEERLSQLQDAHDAWFTLQMPDNSE